ncbi:molybdenum ABC transporter ATP-binding protein [Roseinatronobacter bogoriensis]|uniref:Molybdenum ABC transporter ATP-binding protein n=1 Tax=Roseinatronobacter bogoriensis subsp. barguzinensis TaxID=441209 RepID=A0A2K8KD13_9RHOB|nr:MULTISPECIES: molybdenum ABC transporter ATP-binding protein [Rhodobaca]ATX64648.1 molybdenum ABC transporter ATP-binding protein [Rhodobaca barguzinensis]MBB4209516.1 molybdate transport system ATP-binding protein [Rhodobaca bogoriensis DSM 18756]TDW35119.1 molybdate transport system ATP-binding protein [Rhodobaca barguzinensis]TDY66872.1 molybdate transport system ATP-binding protein [Rhodobaca bogoriensis DSM 18756]
MTLQVALSHHFKGFTLDVAFDAPKGVTVLFGPSGSGKTTLVNAVAGLLRPDKGRIVADDWVLLDTQSRRNLAPHKRRLGYIFQEGRLFPHLSVRQNLLYGRWFAPRGSQDESFDHVVELLGIGPLLTRRPGALSGGEKQRVAIGRALLSAPKLILADEPLAALDEARKAEILPYFERLRDEVSVPILYVSHSSAEVARLATTVVALKDGRVAACGTPADVLGDVAAVGVRGAASVLEARVVAHHADGLTELSTATGALWLPRIADLHGTTIRVRIAAQEVMLSRDAPKGLSALNILHGTIADIRLGDGPGAMVTLALGQERLSARITRRSAQAMGLAIGQPCHAIIKSVAVAPEDIGTGSMKERTQ